MSGPPWRVRSFEWDEQNLLHIEAHAVEPDEVEEAFLGRLYVRRTGRSRYIVLGRTAIGRGLFIVLLRRRDGSIRVITARDMTGREEKLY